MADNAFTPLVNPDTEPFWRGCDEGRLSLQRCTGCGEFRHPPSPVCHACLSPDHEWVQAAGRGAVWSFAVVRERIEGWPGDVPFVVVIVELKEGVKLVSNLQASPDTVHIGMEVEVCFEDGPAGMRLPHFRPV